jgi:lipopolysaccharide export system permease protein
MSFMMKELHKLVGKGIDNFVIFQLITYSIAWMVILAVPMGVLFASLMAFGNLSANHEITVLKASGGSLIRMMLPLLVIATFLSYGLYLYNNYIVPETNHQTVLLMYDLQRKKPTFSIEAGQFSDAIDGYTILARKVDTADNTLHSVTIYDNKQPRISRTINAESCKIHFSEDMTKLAFHLQNGEIHQSENDKLNNYRLIQFVDYTLYSKTSGFGFQRSNIGDISRGDREMKIEDMQKIVDEANEQIDNYKAKLDLLLVEHLNYLLGISADTNRAKDTTSKPNEEAMILRNELTNRTIYEIAAQETFSPMRRNMYSASDRAVVQADRVVSQFIFSLQNIDANIKNASERANSYSVEIHKKYAIPFACIVFILIGCPLGVITRGGNFGISATITLFFYIVYWACLINGEKLADRLIIEPFIGMWFGNILLGIVGIILTVKANNESLAFSDMKIVAFFRKIKSRKNKY